ncbi:MAG TPA: lipopolysaccharide heptosyltransferase II [Pyrinomonadaceae bacterium]|nr:lipopolysaccharide heptosyltransferase II [Pyrinomonadaceae bacterium]
MKIVVRGTNWVGDAVMQIPALRELRRIFPVAHITLHTRNWTEGIFEDVDFIDEVLTIEPNESVFQQAKKLRERNFDLAVLFTNSFQTALVAKLGKVKKRFGYANEGRSFLLTDSVEMPEWKSERHEVFYYLNLVAEIEKNYFGTTKVWENEPRFDLKVSEGRKEQARNFLGKSGVDLSKNLIALCPGSTNSRAKRWQAESYAKLNDKLQNELNLSVVLIGAKDELDVSLEAAEKSIKKPVILTGATSLSEAAAVLSLCDLLVTNDTGPAHISAALGTKTLVIFGPTIPKTTQPWNSEIIRKDVECSPCMLRDCPIDHRCMTGISADYVFMEAVKLLAARQRNL